MQRGRNYTTTFVERRLHCYQRRLFDAGRIDDIYPSQRSLLHELIYPLFFRCEAHLFLEMQLVLLLDGLLLHVPLEQFLLTHHHFRNLHFAVPLLLLQLPVLLLLPLLLAAGAEDLVGVASVLQDHLPLCLVRSVLFQLLLTIALVESGHLVVSLF